MGKLDEILNRYEKSTGRAFKLEPGQKARIRLLPPLSADNAEEAKKKGGVLDEDSGVLSWRIHRSFVRLDESGKPVKFNNELSKTNYRCLMDKGIPCGFCKWHIGLSDQDKKDMKDGRSQVQSAIDIWNYKLGMAQRWFFSKTVFIQLQSLFNTYRKLNSPKFGRNLMVQRFGAGFQTRYTITAFKKSLFEVDKDEWSYIVDELDLVPCVEDPKTIRKIIRLTYGDV